jgi:hypothetical protein
MPYRRSQVAALSLATLGMTLFPQAALASTQAMRITHIVVNTREYSSPNAFTYNGTTYMPLYYVQNMLTAIGIQNSWNGSHTPQVWTLKTKQSQSVNLNLVAKSGSVNVVINGKRLRSRVCSRTTHPTKIGRTPLAMS